MTAIELQGSGGWVNAELTDEEVTKSKLVPNTVSYTHLTLPTTPYV